MESFLKDVKHSIRVLRQSPSFTMTAVAALAIGIAANTAIFTMVNAVVLRPLPYAASLNVDPSLKRSTSTRFCFC